MTHTLPAKYAAEPICPVVPCPATGTHTMQQPQHVAQLVEQHGSVPVRLAAHQ